MRSLLSFDIGIINVHTACDNSFKGVNKGLDAVIIRIIDLPPTVQGITIKDENDDYNIYLNAKLSLDGRGDAFRHEVEHIRSGHFYDCRTVAEKELAVRMGETQKKSG